MGSKTPQIISHNYIKIIGQNIQISRAQFIKQFSSGHQYFIYNHKGKIIIQEASQNKLQFNPLRIPTHVLTNPQLWITHPLPLSGLTCLQPAIVTSLVVPWDSFSYSSDYFDRIPKRQRDGEEIETSTCTVFMRFLFLPPRILSRKSQRWKRAELNFEQHIQISQ